jgi:hypothetical protein
MEDRRRSDHGDHRLDAAFFDETGWLCLIGIARHFPVPSMPLLLLLDIH